MKYITKEELLQKYPVPMSWWDMTGRYWMLQNGRPFKTKRELYDAYSDANTTSTKLYRVEIVQPTLRYRLNHAIRCYDSEVTAMRIWAGLGLSRLNPDTLPPGFSICSNYNPSDPDYLKSPMLVSQHEGCVHCSHGFVFDAELLHLQKREQLPEYHCAPAKHSLAREPRAGQKVWVVTDSGLKETTNLRLDDQVWFYCHAKRVSDRKVVALAKREKQQRIKTAEEENAFDKAQTAKHFAAYDARTRTILWGKP